jgi:phosphoglycerol transferase MdoB-like AlkP superfamily enzyme
MRAAVKEPEPQGRPPSELPARPWSDGLARRVARIVAVNVTALALYRVLFVLWFADPAARLSLPALLWRGFRVDVVLLSVELAVVGIVAFVVRWLRPGPFVAALWGMTVLNVGCAFVNLGFYRERRQHLWEGLLANLDRVSQIGVAVEPFVEQHWWTVPLLLGGLVLVVSLARREARRATAPPRDLWREPRAVGIFLLVIVAGLALGIERVPTKRGDKTRLRIAASKYLMYFPDPELNQAVVNPLFDFVLYHLPAALARPGYRLDAGDALATTTHLLKLAPDDARYPLLRTIRGDGALGIRNVVVILIEGLGTSTLELDTPDGPVMPYLSRLAATGLLFPSCYQSFASTDGSVFAATTSLHRGYDFREKASYFFPYEFTGSFGSLPRILGASGYRHYFFAGFRQRIDEFVSFTSNQGFRAFGYEQLVARLGDRAASAGNTLGLYDHVLLELAGDAVVSEPGPYTIQIMTGTSHSPWKVPDDFDAGALSPELATFRYVDSAIEAFVARLARERRDLDATLFVVTGDHTSLLHGKGGSERLRVPLILWSPRLAERRAEWTDRQALRASHVDLLPTILGRIAGEHPFAGMGRDLLAAPLDETPGLVSSNHQDSIYVKGPWALRYVPASDEVRLSPIDGDHVREEDVADEYPEVAEQLLHEYLSLYETADRLAHAARVFPRDVRPAGDAATGTTAAR